MEASPDVASDPETVACGEAIYHPLLPFGVAGDKVSEMVGETVSIFIVCDTVFEDQPALSTTLPVTALTPSAETVAGDEAGDEFTVKLVEAIPEVASLPVTVTVTGLTHHPLVPWVPARLKLAVGLTVSIFNEAEPIVLVSPQEECAQ
ncbi:MAG TPA: hypothetical protein DF984_07925 [Anaerolineaceae bacterium]|nr:hypothetical protein [Anaerolineaceae bacterium]